MRKYFSFLISHFSFQKGFTLIEILVVVSLMSILMLSSVAIFSSYNRSQSFQVGVSDIVGLLNKAKSRSSTQVKPEECIGQALQGYQISFNSFDSTYKFEVICGGEIYTLEAKQLPPQVMFVEGSSESVFFNVSAGTVTVPADIVVSGFGNVKTISVDGLGNISVK